MKRTIGVTATSLICLVACALAFNPVQSQTSGGGAVPQDLKIKKLHVNCPSTSLSNGAACWGGNTSTTRGTLTATGGIQLAGTVGSYQLDANGYVIALNGSGGLLRENRGSGSTHVYESWQQGATPYGFIGSDAAIFGGANDYFALSSVGVGSQLILGTHGVRRMTFDQSGTLTMTNTGDIDISGGALQLTLGNAGAQIDSGASQYIQNNTQVLISGPTIELTTPTAKLNGVNIPIISTAEMTIVSGVSCTWASGNNTSSCTLPGGFWSVSFDQSYASAPVCTATGLNNAAQVQVDFESVTTSTVVGTLVVLPTAVASSGSVHLMCAGS